MFDSLFLEVGDNLLLDGYRDTVMDCWRKGLPDNWYLGRIRNVASMHSDYWWATAAELAQRSAIGVYPIGGWWKENPQHMRYGRRVRYALTVSIRATNGAVDIYTPVQAQITIPTEVTT